MKITVIGASAGIGLITVQKALERGHEVRALSRDTSAIPDHPLLTRINGSATAVDDVKKAIADTQLVIVTIGTKNKKPNTLFSDSAETLVSAVSALGTDPLILVVTGFGAGESSRYLNFFMRTVIRFFLKNQYINKSLMEDIISSSALRWEIIRPGMLSNAPGTKKYRILPDLYKGMKVGKISRHDVSDFLLAQAENPTMTGKYPALTN